MKDTPPTRLVTGLTIRTLLILCAGVLTLVLLPACDAPAPTQVPTVPSATETEQPIIIFPTVTVATVTPIPSNTATPGPSPTSTILPDLAPQAWGAKPIMVEAARIDADPLAPFTYTPLLVLYGDGLLVKRTCQNGECHYLQAQLDQAALCRLVNAIDRTGFLGADPDAFILPRGTGAAIRLAVHVYAENSVQIPNLDRWVENPDWYSVYAGCPGCFSPPKIDPAFIDLYRLLTTYSDIEMAGLHTERLAVWLTRPVIAGSAQPWEGGLPPLSELAALSACPGDPNRRAAVILTGQPARAVSGFLSAHGGDSPVFTQDGITWEVHSRWLLPDEMPQTCDTEAGLYPPSGDPGTAWVCAPEMGAIPTSTPTITPTATITPTPLR